jgi:hypothetical protein
MDFLTSFAPSWMNLNIFMGLLILSLGLGLYLAWRWYTGSHSPFMNIEATEQGEECDPQLENACGKDASCQPDESGEKGICFPKEEEGDENIEAE